MQPTDPRRPAPTLEGRTQPTGAPAGTPLPLPIESLPFDERFEDHGLIAPGGMGEVRRVRDRILDRMVAMKLLPPGGEVDAALDEARIAARLQHPGIVPIYEVGQLADGRRWLTMREVEGRDLGAVLAAAAHEGWPRRRLVDVFARVCEAMAFAHEHRVVHRDLKPANVRVGRFGEVVVLDWGIARPIGAEASPAGTPGYVAPEQRAGTPPDPRADVWSLGVLLRRVLAAAPGDGDDALDRLAAAATADDPAHRPADAAALLAVVSEWLDGARRRAEARQMVAEARRMRGEIETLLAEADADERAAAEALEPLPPHAPVAEKAQGWRLEDAAAAARRRARGLQLDFEQRLQAARRRADDLAEARHLLADYYRERVIDAEGARDGDTAAEYETRLRELGDDRHAAFLAGDGALTLLTDPPGAEVWCARYETRARRLVPGSERLLGHTPLVDAPLGRGSWRLRLVRPGHHPVVYPVCLGRGERWDGIPPGQRDAMPVALPPLGELEADERYVPGGWFWSGGDRHAIDGLPRRRFWVDGFVMGRHPLTYRELIDDLNALWAAGERDRARRIAPPPTPPSGAGSDGYLSVEPGPDGFRLVQRRADVPVDGWPVALIDWHAADAWATWRAERAGRPWRLPHDLEWEKAARGTDGRFLPWGDHFDPTWANVLDSSAEPPVRRPVGEPPEDVGPYDIAGLAGNVRNWCCNGYRRLGPPPEVRRLVVHPAAPGQSHRMLRGGAWAVRAEVVRAASRFAERPDTPLFQVGVRLVRPWPGAGP